MMRIDVEDIIINAEANLQVAPPGFAAGVMRRLPKVAKAARIPIMDRRLSAVACFASAAVIILFTVSGFDWNIVTENSERISEWLAYTQILFTGD